MIRPIVVLALLLSAAVMMRGLAGDWRKNLTSPATEPPKKATAPAGGAAAGSPPPQAKGLQPPVPGVLPDLKVGYLFNPERMLASAEITPSASDNTAEGASENTLGITASMSEVNYTGSIITDDFSRAIVVYPAAKTAGGQQPMASRSSKARPQPAAAAAGSEEHAKLAVGDVLDGYEVTEILPDKLIFTKGGETVEKLLYDPDKKRQAAPPRPAAGPMPGGGAAARSPQQVTIGGNEAPPAPPGIPQSGSPAAPSHAGSAGPLGAPAPTSPPAVKSPTTGTTPTTPLRRMVISRQPAPGPDTSRVIRQSQGIDGMIPLPPGIGPK